MVLDIDRFRPEKGGNPQEVKENQRKRYSDESIVDKIVAADENWRKGIVKAHPSSQVIIIIIYPLRLLSNMILHGAILF